MKYMHVMNSRLGRRQTKGEAEGGGIPWLHHAHTVTNCHNQFIYVNNCYMVIKNFKALFFL